MTPDHHTITIWLAQLERLARLQREYADDVNDVGAKLLSRAIKCRYLDLMRAGHGVAARRLMTSLNPSAPLE